MKAGDRVKIKADTTDWWWEGRLHPWAGKEVVVVGFYGAYVKVRLLRGRNTRDFHFFELEGE